MREATSLAIARLRRRFAIGPGQATIEGDVLPVDTQFAGDVAGLYNALLLESGAVDLVELTDAVKDLMPYVSISVGAEDAFNNIDVTLQLKDADGNNLAKNAVLRLWLSDNNPYLGEGTAPSGGVSDNGAGNVLKTLTANVHVLFITDGNGTGEVRITEAGAGVVWYLNVEFDGIVYASRVEFA